MDTVKKGIHLLVGFTNAGGMTRQQNAATSFFFPAKNRCCCILLPTYSNKVVANAKQVLFIYVYRCKPLEIEMEKCTKLI